MGVDHSRLSGVGELGLASKFGEGLPRSGRVGKGERRKDKGLIDLFEEFEGKENGNGGKLMGSVLDQAKEEEKLEEIGDALEFVNIVLRENWDLKNNKNLQEGDNFVSFKEKDTLTERFR